MLTKSFNASNTIVFDKTRDAKLTQLGYLAVSTATDYVNFMLRNKVSAVLINFDSISDDDCLSLHLVNQIYKSSLTYFGISSNESAENDAQVRSLIGPDLTFEMVIPKTYSKQQIDHLILLCQKRRAIQDPITFVQPRPKDTKAIELATILPRFSKFKVTRLLFIFFGVIVIVILSIITDIIFAPPVPNIDSTSEPTPDNNIQWQDFEKQSDIKVERQTVIALRPRLTPTEVNPSTPKNKPAKIPVAEAIKATPKKNPVKISVAEVIKATPKNKPSKLPVAEAIIATSKNKPVKKNQSIEPDKKTQEKATVDDKLKPELLTIATLTPSDKKELLQYNSLAITQIQQKFYSPISEKSSLYFFNEMYKISDSNITLSNLINNITGNILSDVVDAIKKQDMPALKVAGVHLRRVADYIRKLEVDIHNQPSYQNMLSRYRLNITNSELTLVNDIEPASHNAFKHELEEINLLLEELCKTCFLGPDLGL